MPRFELQIFGDESTAPGLITYGLVVFSDSNHERQARYRWQKVLRSFGADGRARTHARELFSGQARAKTCWSHLNESETSALVESLVRTIKEEGAIFSLGVADVSTYPEKGVPDGLDESGNQRFIKWKPSLFYGFALLAAVTGLKSSVPAMQQGCPYKLFLDPISEAVKLFTDLNAVQVINLIQTIGLKPTTFSEEPLLLDAADLFAYASGRALSKEAARNKQVCTNIYNLTGAFKTDWFWDTTTPAG